MLAFWAAALAAVTAAWILGDSSLRAFGDSGADHTWPLYVAHALRLGGISGALQVLGDLHATWPPGLFLVHGLLGYLFGEDLFWMRLYNLLYLPPLMWGVYRLGLQLGGDARAATLAAVLAVFNFSVAFHLRHICIDTPSMVMTVLVMLALLRARDLDRPGAVIALGALVGLGLLFRVQVLLFVTVPALLAGAQAVAAAGGRERLRRLGWIALGVLAAALISSPYWARQLPRIAQECLAHLGLQVTAASAAPGNPGFVSGLGYYGLALGQTAGWPVVLVALGTAPLLLRRRRRSLLLLLWVMGGVLLTAVGAGREPRYLLPLVPALALLAALGLQQLAPAKRRLITAALLLTTALPTLWIAGFGQDLFDRGIVSRLFHRNYLRAPVRRSMEEALGDTRRALDRFMPSPDGEGACLFFGGFAQEELIATFAPRYPRALLVTLQDNGDSDYPRWRKVMARPRRRLVVSVYQKYRLRLLWKGRYNHLPVYIHELTDPYVNALRFSPPLDIEIQRRMEEDIRSRRNRRIAH